MTQRDEFADLRAAIANDLANAGPPQRNIAKRIGLILATFLFAAVLASVGTHWYRSNQWQSQGTLPPIDEMQWTGKETLDFVAAKKAVDQWLADQGFQSVPVAEAPEDAQSLAAGLSMKKAPLDKQNWYRSPPGGGEPFYVVTFVHSAPTEWENIRAEYLGCCVVWEYSGFRWNVEANKQNAETFLKEARQWWEVNRHQWERPS